MDKYVKTALFVFSSSFFMALMANITRNKKKHLDLMTLIAKSFWGASLGVSVHSVITELGELNPTTVFTISIFVATLLDIVVRILKGEVYERYNKD